VQGNSHKVIVVARKLLPAGLDPLESRYEVRVGGFEVTREELLALAPGANALIADPGVRVDAELLEACGDRLKLVANFAVGYDNIDIEACGARGVIVTNTPNVLTQATAELALALTLAAARRMSDAERDLRAGRWTGWDPGAYLGLELAGAPVGVIGMGRIGQRYARMVRALGAELFYASPTPKLDAERQLGARRLEFKGVLAACDIVSLHAPATPQTHHLVGAAELGLIGRNGVLVNTARGSLVDTEALADALIEGRLGAAGLDVYENEPEVAAKLLEAPRCVLLPHIGSASAVSRDSMALLVADNVISVLEGGEPRSQVP
jgi:glyoxylate reductase